MRSIVCRTWGKLASLLLAKTREANGWPAQNLVDLVESGLLLKGAYTYTPGAIGRLWLLASCHQRRRSLSLSCVVAGF